MAARQSRPARRAPASRDAHRGDNAFRVERYLQAHHAAEFEVAAEKRPHELRFGLDGFEGSVLNPIAEWNGPAHPGSPSSSRPRDLVADALAGDFPLELREGEQHVKGQPPPYLSSC